MRIADYVDVSSSSPVRLNNYSRIMRSQGRILKYRGRIAHTRMIPTTQFYLSDDGTSRTIFGTCVKSPTLFYLGFYGGSDTQNYYQVYKFEKGSGGWQYELVMAFPYQGGRNVPPAMTANYCVVFVYLTSQYAVYDYTGTQLYTFSSERPSTQCYGNQWSDIVGFGTSNNLSPLYSVQEQQPLDVYLDTRTVYGGFIWGYGTDNQAYCYHTQTGTLAAFGTTMPAVYIRAASHGPDCVIYYDTAAGALVRMKSGESGFSAIGSPPVTPGLLVDITVADSANVICGERYFISDDDGGSWRFNGQESASPTARSPQLFDLHLWGTVIMENIKNCHDGTTEV